jgi:aspartate/methionine/tyrosine aminotransferase
MHPLRDITGPDRLRSPYEDVRQLRRYQDEGGDLDHVLYMSLGETWDGPPPGLRDALRAAVDVDDVHGYQLTPYGRPSLTEVLTDYIPRTHQLTDYFHPDKRQSNITSLIRLDYDIVASAGSTRQVMYDFGRLLLQDAAEERRYGPAIAVSAAPAWDYQGIFAGSLGYTFRHFSLDTSRGYQPDPEEVVDLVLNARRDTTGPVLLILNAQHNPTGVNWAPDTVLEIVQKTLADIDNISILIDDAYYAVHDPETTPTSALRILLDEYNTPSPRERSTHWLAVRSLGKQFGCNGWGIGAVAGAPDTLKALYTRLRPEHTYATAVPLQAAMAQWLLDPAADAHLAQQRELLGAARAEAVTRIHRDLHYPADTVVGGDCTPYMLLPAPPWYRASEQACEDGEFRHHCLKAAGVLLGEGRMSTPGRPAYEQQETVRLYLGHGPQTVAEALERMAAANLDWHGPRDPSRPAPPPRGGWCFAAVPNEPTEPNGQAGSAW